MSSPSVREQVLALAQQHGVSTQPNGLDEMALGITHAAGDDIEMDEADIALVHLIREGHISLREGQQFYIQYHSQE